MIYPQVADYIKNSLAKNIPIEQIKKSLLGKGWRESDVDEAIALTNQTLPTEIKPAETTKMKTEKPKKKISPAIIFAVVGIFSFVLIAGLVIYFVVTMTSGKLSDEEISLGASVNLSSGKEIKFNFGEEEHKIVVDSVSEDSVGITIYSEPVSATLTIGETEKFDLDSDEIYDLSVKLNGITEGKADIYIFKISEAICTEEWECTNWTSCADSSQSRTCADANECGTEENKPEETQECVVEIELSCSDKNGTICESYEECDGTLEDNCCLGNCTRIQAIACETNIDCLINASDTCHFANMTYDMPSSNSTIQTITYLYSVEGFEDEEEERCEFYTGIKNVEGNFTEAEWTAFQDGGYSDEEIASMLEDIHSGLVETSGVCIFSTSELEDYLTQIKEENHELTDEEITTYECTGSLYS